MFNTNLFSSTGSSNITTDVLFVGVAATYGGVPVGRLFPLSNTGDLNFSFNTGTGLRTGAAFTALKSSYGGYYIGGTSMTTYRGISCGNLIRLNADGSLDTSWGIQGSGGVNVYTITEDSSGNIYVGGTFSNWMGTGRNQLIKLSRSGVLDTSFDPNVGSGIVYKVVIDSAGKLYVGGSFTTVNGVTANRIIKVNLNGTKDTSFDNTTGFDGAVRDMVISPTGKIYVAGQFLNYKGVPARSLVRLNTNGSLDNTFPTGTKFVQSPGNPNAFFVAEDDAGNVYAGGNFISYDSNPIRGLCKLDSSANFVPFLANPATAIPSLTTALRTPENQFYISANNGLHFISATGAPVSGFVPKAYSGTPFGICLI